jgi:hypothetical protein
MIVVLGLVVLVVAVVVGVAAVVGNLGGGHGLTHGFAVFGYHVTGSTGTLFLYGVVVGAVAVVGLSLLLSGARRASRRGRVARSELRQSRRETAAVSHDRDSLLDQGARSPRGERRLTSDGDGHRHHLFGRRPRRGRSVAATGDQDQPTESVS